MPSRIPYHGSSKGPSAVPVQRSADRLADNRFYASTVWRKLRSAFLAAFPLCQECEAKGRIEPATEVHHVRERKTHPDLALDWDNLKALCHTCHLSQRRKPQ